MRVTNPVLLAAVVVIALSASLAPAQTPAPVPAQAPPQATAAYKEAVDHFAAGRFAEALTAAETGLEFAPDHRDLLDLASTAAAEANEHDLAIFYADALRGLLGDGKDEQQLAAKLTARIAELDLVAGQAGDVVRKFDELSSGMLALAKCCESRKLYANSVDLLLACKGTRHEQRADAELDRLYAKEDVASALLLNGMDLPERELTADKARHIAAMDSKHADWANAWRKETRNYDVKTDMGYVMLNDICTAMDEMNRYYRKVFEPRGNPKKCKIDCFKSRAEFDQNHSGVRKTIRGFFSPDETRMVTYDSRSDGRSLADFWSVLFHEASHQFTHEISKGLVPAWLNEGTASYFEGARLLPNGSVEVNLIPRNRLDDLGDTLRSGKPSLKEVVSFHEPGSYGGECYATGWGLVYFALNYEDDKCERPYVAAYKAFLESWKKNNEKSSAYDRFVDYFVTKPKRPGIASFADFEKLWSDWMLALHAVCFGGPEQADGLITKARRQVKAKKLDAALESYRFALAHRPDDLAALTELAALQTDQGARDAAVVNLRRALQLARQVDPATPAPNLDRTCGAIAADCLDRISKIDKAVGDGVRGSVSGFAASAAAAADVYAKGGFPRRALMVLDDAIDLLRGDHELALQRDRIATDSDADVSRWRRIPITPGLEGFTGAGGFKVDGESLVGAFDPTKRTFAEAQLVQFLTFDERLGSRYVVEAVVESDGDFATGVIFGESASAGMKAVVIGPTRGISTFVYDEKKGPDFTPPKGKAKEGPVRLGAEVRVAPGATTGTVTFLIDGAEAGQESFDARDFRPRAGVFAFLSQGRLHDLRVRR